MNISILGSAVTHFGELWQSSLMELCQQAVQGAALDAEIGLDQVEAVFVANKASGAFVHQHHLNAMVSQLFPHFPPAWRIEGACASGGLALLNAEYALLSGKFETVMVVGVEKMTDASAAETTRILSSAADAENEYGSTFPALYALIAQSHMKEFGTTREQLSAVAVKNHAHALDNPQAQFHKKLSLEAVSQSLMVAEPLRIFDCSPISDGAAAVILRRDKKTGTIKGKTQIIGAGHGQDTVELAKRQTLSSFAATRRAAQQAFSEAGVTAKEIGAVELHDCFTIAELIALEDLGFFKPGKAGKATLDGLTTYGGEVVVNPSGGLKACGHPVGATGVKQLVYLDHFLKTHDAEHALAHNVGGSGATSVVHVLRRPE